MNIFNIIKKASVGLGLLLVTTIINSNYYYANADDTKQESANKNHKSKNNKYKNGKKASKEEIEAIKNMYKSFQDSINSTVTEDKVKSFYSKYFDSNIYRTFGIKKEQRGEFDKLLINYFVKLLSSDLIQKTKGYKLTDKFSKIGKKKSVTVKCQLKKDGEDDIIEMSVVLTKDRKIKEFSIMNSFQLIKGAKNIVENYCTEKKGKEYKKFKANERISICKEAWEQNK